MVGEQFRRFIDSIGSGCSGFLESVSVIVHRLSKVEKHEITPQPKKRLYPKIKRTDFDPTPMLKAKMQRFNANVLVSFLVIVGNNSECVMVAVQARVYLFKNKSYFDVLYL